MILLYQDAPIFLWGFTHSLGSVRRDLNKLKDDELLGSSIETLSKIGYRYNFGLAEHESLLTLATMPFSEVLQRNGEPRAIIFQHCYAQSAVLPWASDETDLVSRNRYFGPALMRNVQVDHVPYLCSFASGCAGFISVLATAAGLYSPSNEKPAVCVIADRKPPGVMFDIIRERILGSDHSSAFLVGREPYGYQVLGINYYSTTRKDVPLVEVVKRTVQMVQELGSRSNVELSKEDVAIHYPNIFPETWEMVTRYLRLPRVEHVMEGFSERAHAGGSDSVITLKNRHRGQEGRFHMVVNYGIGLHLGVCMLMEKAGNQLGV
jgi:hypothetical protein